MLILALETSTLVTSLAVSMDGRLMYERTAGRLRGHGSRLFPMAQMLLDEASITISDVDCIAVSTGPGSFTAVRIGVAAVKALAMAAPRVKIAAVDTLEAMATGLFAPGRVVCPLLDARKGEVYGAAFRSGGARPERLTEDLCGRVEEVVAAAGPGAIVFGGGARVYEERIAASTGGSAVFAPLTADLPRASLVAALAPLVLESDGPTTRGDLHPVYLRKPVIRRGGGE